MPPKNGKKPPKKDGKRTLRSDNTNTGGAQPTDGADTTPAGRRQALLATLLKATEAACDPGFKEKWEAREQRNLNFHKKGGAKKLADKEKEKHDARRDATAIYEDSLYYQVPEHREHYKEHIDGERKLPGRGAREVEKKQTFKHKTLRAPMLWPRKLGNPYEKPIEDIIERYDQDHVGMPENLNLGLIGPFDLHLYVPHTRRNRVGLGRPNPPTTIPPLKLKVDEDAIEVERKKHDGVIHTERRRRETELLGDIATEIVPTASNLRNGVPTKTLNGRQASGLFLAAAENSSDWLTSYDQMDIIKTGTTAVERKKVRKFDEIAETSVPSGTTGDDLEENRQPEADGVLNEFCMPKRKHKKFKHLETTPWAETAYGRRERDHAHMMIRPSSPVLSPPHSPNPSTRTLNIPTDVPRNHRDFVKYRARFKDQYGVSYKEWPSFNNMRTGRGYKVPYEPLDVPAQLENRKYKNYQDNKLTNKHGRYALPAPDGTSMRLLREALNDDYRPPQSPRWKGMVPSDEEDSEESEDGGGGGYDGLESDDEGDLFRDSYLECSQAAGGALTAGTGGGDGPEPDVPAA